ncbi:MAG: orotate phosphoribosyltransferase [Gammaproteobacteria bacterium]|nr:orotate phosphoribosyltransferase [Gammaproteobacteria bacterium]
MQPYQLDFIKFCISRNVLSFGEFKLKSGRLSPYFFNFGLFNTGEDLAKIGHYYAAAIMNNKLDFAVLFGPAYKGIPLVTASAIALAQNFKHNVPYAFNRKEAKDHGEGGNIVGSDLRDKKVLIIDDVITAGTAINESMQILNAAGATAVGVIVSLDRQERGQGTQSAIQEITKRYNIPVTSIIDLDNIVEYLQQIGQDADIEKIKNYRVQYGI